MPQPTPKTEPDAPDNPEPESVPSGFRAITGALWAGNLFAPFLASSVAAILPAMGRDLHATAVHLSMVMVVYALAQVIFNILGGRFGDLWGRRRILLIGVALFTIISVAMGFAQDIASLLSLRFFQGMATAMISSCSTAIAISLAPRSRRGQIMGVMTSAVYLGLTMGPLVGGGVATALHWRWLFIGILAPGILVWVVLKHFIRQEWREARGEPLDVIGAVLLFAGLGLITAGAGSMGIMPGLLWLLVPGFAVMALFLARQWRTAYPILDIRLFGQARGMGVGMLATFINYGSTMGLVFFFSLYLQQVRGLTPWHAGQFLMLQSVVQVIISPLGGRLADKLGAERVAAGGMVLCGLAIMGVSMLNKTTPLIWVVVCQVVLGLGVGCFNAPNMVSTLRNVPMRQLAVASGLMGSMRTMGMLFSQVLIVIILGHYMGTAAVGPENADSFLKAMRTALMFFAVLNMCGIFLGLSQVLPKPGRKVR